MTTRTNNFSCIRLKNTISEKNKQIGEGVQRILWCKFHDKTNNLEAHEEMEGLRGVNERTTSLEMITYLAFLVSFPSLDTCDWYLSHHHHSIELSSSIPRGQYKGHIRQNNWYSVEFHLEEGNQYKWWKGRGEEGDKGYLLNNSYSFQSSCDIELEDMQKQVQDQDIPRNRKFSSGGRGGRGVHTLISEHTEALPTSFIHVYPSAFIQLTQPPVLVWLSSHCSLPTTWKSIF